MSLKKNILEICDLAAGATTFPTLTAIPGVLLIKGDVPEHQLSAIYEPMIGFLVQGAKDIHIGDQTISLKAPSYFVIPTELPATGKAHEGPQGESYLSVGLRINSNLLLSLLNEIPKTLDEEKITPDFSPCPATAEFVDAWLRLLRLLKSPADIPALAPAYEREILYRVLQGPDGWRLRRSLLEEGISSKIRQAILWIRENYTRPLDVKKMAVKCGMAVTTFHRKFKEITGLSPVQFQKNLRLVEARKLLVFSDHTVSETAFEVGYESPSQFNREYSRLFGASPAKDALKMKKIEDKRSR